MNVQGSVTQVLLIEDNSQIGHARRVAQRLAEQHDFDTTDAGRVALLATELGSNLLKHAGRGELHLRVIPGREGRGVEIIAIDRGPGFDLDQCLTDGFSTRGTQGIGLGARLDWRVRPRCSTPIPMPAARWCWRSCFLAACSRRRGATASASIPIQAKQPAATPGSWPSMGSAAAPWSSMASAMASLPNRPRWQARWRLQNPQ